MEGSEGRRPSLGERARRAWRTVAPGSALVLVALWGLAVAQPVLDLFGNNPEFFVVNDLLPVEIVLFALAVVVVGPVVLLAVELVAEALSPTVGRAVHTGLVSLLATALGFVSLAQLDVEDDLVVFLLAPLLGVAAAYAERYVPPVRMGLRYLAAAPVLFLVVFLAFSPAADILRGGEDVTATPGEVGREAPIVVLSLDELPVATLLTPEGELDARRFPNFARLAETSSWYRAATSIAPTTTESVPALLTGRFPDEDGGLPTYRDHQRSLFTLLGSGYEQTVVEQVTDVCPNVICPDEEGGIERRRLQTALVDAAAVYAQQAMPPSVDELLPAVDRSWGGFITEGEGIGGPGFSELVRVATEGPGDTGERAAPLGADPDCPDIDLWCGAARISELTESIDAGSPNRLWFAHATFPHSPWIRSAQGAQYAPRTLDLPGVEIGAVWGADEDLVRQGFQRHVLQVQYLDALLGDLIDRLEEAGLWEDALVVVAADHGVAFDAGEPVRVPAESTLHEIYNVPLFITAPGQTEGEVSDENALNVDVLPTIVDLLDITVDGDWDFDGRSLVGDEPPPAEKPVWFEGTRTNLPLGIQGVLAVARRNAQLLPRAGELDGVEAVGPDAELVGRSVESLDVSGDGPAWTADVGPLLADWAPDEGDLTPLLLNGRIDLQGAPPPQDGLVVVNGIVAGAAVAVTEDGGDVTFSALLVEGTLQPGPNDVRLLLPVAPGADTFTSAPLS